MSAAGLPSALLDKVATSSDVWVFQQAFESLAILEGTSSMAQRALQSNAKLRFEDSRNLSTYFNKVQRPACAAR